jgi:predicted transcriptional regulator
MSDLKVTAKQYWLEGCNIVLLKGKEPLHKWSQWQNERQTELNFEALPWNEADGFAIICGQQLHNELYVGAIDFDVKNLPQETIDKGKQVLKHLLCTQIEETPSKGQHWIYFCHNKPKSVSAYHNECALEILGEGKLCIMAPSQGYKRVNDNTPSTVQDLEAMFYEAIHKAGVKIQREQPAWFDSPELSGKPYRGKDPLCVQALMKGTSEGLRNEYGIRLCSYFINFKQYQPKTVREEILKSWNKLNSPELHWKELDALVKSAVQGKYVYGCNDDILSRVCDKANCPLQPKEKMVFDDETKEKARQLLRDPAFFYKLGKVFEYGFLVPKINKPRFVIKEERNKRLLGFLLAGAAKHGMTSIIKLLGEPGTAKDSILRMWLELLPLKVAERSFFTAATLRYSEQLQNADLLYIPDSPELRGEKGRHLRFMRADDGGLISEYALKDPETGEMTTKTVTLPVKAVATTSNIVTGDTALESGMWTLHTNSSSELTKQVKLEKLKFRAGKRPLFPEDELKVWKCAFWLMLEEEPMEELPKIPFAENLADLLASERSESRRDPDKLCDLISIIAWARRFQKPKEQWAEADWLDLYIALQLGLDAITETISDLDAKEQQIFKVVKNAVAEDVTCRYVAEETGIPYKTCYRLLEKMLEKGFLNKDKKQGRNVYSAFKEKEPKEFLISVDISPNSPAKLLEQVLRFVGDFSPSHGVENGGYSLIDPLTGGKLAVELNDGKPTVKIEPINIEPVSLPPSQGGEKVRSAEITQEKVSNGENKPLNLISQLMRKDLLLDSERISKNRPEEFKPLNGLFVCELCAKQGEAMFFANQHDLNVHIKSWHCGR